MENRMLSCMFRIYAAHTPDELLSAISTICIVLEIPVDWSHADDWRSHLCTHVLPLIEMRHPGAASLIANSIRQIENAPHSL